LKKAKAAMAECRILLAYWLEFAVDGDFPSGQNEEDALRYVLNRSYADKSNDLDDDDDDEDEETFSPQNEDDNRSENGSDDHEQNNVRNSRNASESHSANINDEYDDESDDPEYNKVLRNDAPSSFCPCAWVLFMLYGPYGSAHYNFEISTAFTMDTDAIEESAKSGKLSNKSIREAKSVEKSAFRFEYFKYLVSTIFKRIHVLFCFLEMKVKGEGCRQYNRQRLIFSKWNINSYSGIKLLLIN
jgi:hypothetical protein